MKEARLAKIVERESLLWGDDVAEAYHGAAKRDMKRHWDTIIWPVLSRFPVDYSQTIDFACGRGRNTEYLRPLASELTMVDVNEENLAYCRQYFAGDNAIKFHHCNGFDISGLHDGSASFFYTFDSMVHFDVEIIASYLHEFRRVIRPGGMAFIHHSNYSASPGSRFQDNPHWRNYMSADLFRHLSLRAGFSVPRQDVISWGGVRAIDCLTVLKG
jgi:ubiquinone/menaquinone biosynthesis C-methylase UbiE